MSPASPLGYARLHTRDSKDEVHFAALLNSTGIQLIDADRGESYSISALRGPSFICAWASVPVSRYQVRRAGTPLVSRTLFVFANAGHVHVGLDGQTMPLARGDVAAVAPGSSTIELVATGERNEVVLFSIDVAVAGGDEDAVPVQGITRLSDPTLNTFVFTSCYGLAQAPVPTSKATADTVEHAAATLARGLLARMAHLEEPDLYRASLRHIRLHAADPNLSPSTLADRFKVSTRKLQLRYSQEGDTVVSAIRRSRAAIAHSIWQRDPSLAAAIVAARSGFTSARIMRRALAEFPE
ncbi:AraC-like DNA-binding protein [Pseudoclavibacter sp. JAI123]|uniref:hypothetical protein n=1 Tax=Pseudoclavibacter sp. JAI123 TaxID=2723065 RepID=UPI0015CAC7B6|nr:hypothetical protein [Pseudoclavibacter sp. JAI123]NYF13590.1 AraC-like DNA-binding protein [Pseudoclavibacter sp. JAI123]